MKKLTHLFYLIAIISFTIAIGSCEQEETTQKQEVSNSNYLTTSSDFIEEPLCNKYERDLISFKEAFARVLSKQEPLERVTAKDLNMSKQLYTFICSILNNSETTETRSNPLPPNSDCVPLTIAFLKGFSKGYSIKAAKQSDEFWSLYRKISSYIYANYGADGLTWDEFGCNYEKLLQKCFRYCRKERFFRDEYNPKNENSGGISCQGIAVIKTSSSTTLHSVIILSIQDKNLVYFDPSTERYSKCSTSEIACIYYVARMKENKEIAISLSK